MQYLDNFTKRPIEYSKDDVFIIAIKGSYRKKRHIKYFTADKIDEAFKSFYDLDVSINQRKYLLVLNRDSFGSSEGKTIYSMKGYLPSSGTIKLKLGNGMISYQKTATINMVHTPISLAKKIDAIDFDQFPVINEKWTKTKLAYVLFSWLVNQRKETIQSFLADAYRFYISEKLESGGSLDDANIYKELVKK